MARSSEFPPCNPEVYKHGTLVLASFCDGVSPSDLREWVKEVSHRADQLVDWHTVVGYRRVLSLGDPQRTIAKMLEPDLEEAYNQAFKRGAGEEFQWMPFARRRGSLLRYELFATFRDDSAALHYLDRDFGIRESDFQPI